MGLTLGAWSLVGVSVDFGELKCLVIGLGLGFGKGVRVVVLIRVSVGVEFGVLFGLGLGFGLVFGMDSVGDRVLVVWCFPFSNTRTFIFKSHFFLKLNLQWFAGSSHSCNSVTGRKTPTKQVYNSFIHVKLAQESGLFRLDCFEVFL